MDFGTDIGINVNKLEEEWLKQSTLMYNASREASKAYREWGDQKDIYNVMRAGIELQLRKGEIELKGNDEKPIKLNNDIVKAYLDNDESLKVQLKAIADAKYEYDIASGAVNSIEHRKRSLTYIVELRKMNWWSEPTERVNQTEALNDKLNNK